jgi:hypothetical protein
VRGTLLALPPQKGAPTALGALGSGLCVGAAALIKQQAGMQLPILMLVLLAARAPLRARGRGRLGRGWIRRGLGGSARLAVGDWIARRILLLDHYNQSLYIAHGNRFGDGLQLLARSASVLAGASPALWLVGGAGLLWVLARVREPNGLTVPLWFFGSLIPVSL